VAAVADNDLLRGPEPAPLGSLLVARGFLSKEQLDCALAEQAEIGRPLGAILVERGIVRPALIAQALATQHGGILKTEYGYATGFDARLGEEPAPVEEGQPESHPPVSPAAGLSGLLRLGADEAGPEPVPPAPAPVGVPDQAVMPTGAEAVEMELAYAVGENEKLRARVGELQLEAVRLRAEAEARGRDATVVGARVAGLDAAVAALQAEKAQLLAEIHRLRRGPDDPSQHGAR
jgi:hypothetical protein